MTVEDPTDLVCRAHRGQLGAEELAGLERCLSRVPEARLVHALLEELEGESCVQPGDDALVARIAARAASRSERAPRRLPRALLAAIAVLLVGGAASAWTAGVLPRPFGRSSASALPVAPSASSATARVIERGAASSGAPLAAREAPSSEPASSSPERAAGPRSSPAELLAAANRARREGRAGEAQRLYRTIVEAHAGSREAPVARLALAKLLSGSSPGAALSHFEVLAASSGGLRAEGLWGQADCARRLGRVTLERQALAALVREYPTSAYAEAARGRIADGGR